MVKIKLYYRTDIAKIANVTKRMRVRLLFITEYKPWLDANKIYYIFDQVSLELSMEPEDMTLFRLKFNV